MPVRPSMVATCDQVIDQDAVHLLNIDVGDGGFRVLQAQSHAFRIRSRKDSFCPKRNLTS